MTEAFSAVLRAVFYVKMHDVVLWVLLFHISVCRGGLSINRTWHTHTHMHTDMKLQLLAVCHGEWKWLIAHQHRMSSQTKSGNIYSFTFQSERRVSAPPQGQTGSLQFQFQDENIIHGWNCFLQLMWFKQCKTRIYKTLYNRLWDNRTSSFLNNTQGTADFFCFLFVQQYLDAVVSVKEDKDYVFLSILLPLECWI